MAYDLKKFTGEYFLRPNDVREQPLQRRIAGLREGKFGKLEAIFDSGEVLSLNATNTRVLLNAYGDDSDALVGKVIELFLGQNRIKRRAWSKRCAATANQLVICCFPASNTAFARPPPSSAAWTPNSASTRSRSSRSA
jgi:hypothetical protein